ncbi:MAG: hypothetical protein ACK49D_10165 [Flavobacteriia bacterium]|jgi:hypothetical protein|nr:hypothetical protein [Cryomorphaceae bacterium]
MKNQKIYFSLLIIFLLINLTSCAPIEYEQEPSGFFSGFWHGMILIFSLLGKLFGFDIGIYALHNTGFTYWLGFILGIGALGGGAASTRG